MDISHPCAWAQKEAKASGVKSKLVEEKDLVRINSNVRRQTRSWRQVIKSEAI